MTFTSSNSVRKLVFDKVEEGDRMKHSGSDIMAESGHRIKTLRKTFLGIFQSTKAVLIFGVVKYHGSLGNI